MKVVKKAWGEEEWIVNDVYCGKRLVLNAGWRSSIHCHKNKDETFYVTRGRMLVEVGEAPDALGERIMTSGDTLRLTPGTWHRFTGIEETEFFEFSTHHEDSDTYRASESGPVPAPRDDR